MLFKRAFIAIVLVLAVHVVLLVTGGYAIPQMDTPMHFLGGFAMALLGLAVHHAATNQYHASPSPVWYRWLFVMGFVMLMGVAWEFHEYVFDRTIAVWFDVPKAQLSIGETMKDLLLDAVGASVAFLFFKRRC